MSELLLQKQAIEAVLVRYAKACDRRDWALLDQVFHPDVDVNYGGEYRLKGRAAVVAMIKSMLGGCGPTQHLLGNFTIALDGDQADCSCYVRAAHSSAQKTDTADSEELFYEVWAEYRDHLVWVDNQWLIDQREMIVYKETGSRDVLAPES